MRKLWLIIAALAGLTLTACAAGSAGVTAPPLEPTAPAIGTRIIAPSPTAAAPVQDPLPTTEPATCTVASRLPTPGPTEASLFPGVSAADWKQGPDSASVVFIEYSDFQCPYCGLLAPVLEQLAKTYPQDVQIIFRHFPLDGHDKSLLAAQAAEAAGKQGKFWEMHDGIFNGQNSWADLQPGQFSAWLLDLAKGLGMEPAKFEADMKGDEIVNKVKQARTDAMNIPIPGTPFLLINGKPYEGPRDSESLTAIVNLTTLQSRQFSECPPMTVDAKKLYTATIKTDIGDIVIQLFPDKAPVSVNSFVFLARHNWFDHTIFHRVLPGFIAQAGDPSGSGYGGPGYAFTNEITAASRFDKPGLVGLANSGPNSNGSQFFITYTPTPDLDGQYTIFGQVIQGLDIAEKLTARDPSLAGALPEASKILSVTIVEK